jgi:hypothetical protein
MRGFERDWYWSLLADLSPTWRSVGPESACRADLAAVCNLILVNEAAPNRRALGAINGESNHPQWESP